MEIHELPEEVRALLEHLSVPENARKAQESLRAAREAGAPPFNPDLAARRRLPVRGAMRVTNYFEQERNSAQVLSQLASTGANGGTTEGH